MTTGTKNQLIDSISVFTDNYELGFIDEFQMYESASYFMTKYRADNCDEFAELVLNLNANLRIIGMQVLEHDDTFDMDEVLKDANAQLKSMRTIFAELLDKLAK